MKLNTTNMKRLILVIITTFLVSCGGVSNCNVDDNTVIRYVIDDLSLTRVLPMRFKSKQDVIDLCNNYKPNLIGCTTQFVSYVYEDLVGFERVAIIAHEFKHQEQFQIGLTNQPFPFPLPENEAIAYGLNTANRLCN